MQNKICIHPKKVIKIMRNFITLAYPELTDCFIKKDPYGSSFGIFIPNDKNTKATLYYCFYDLFDNRTRGMRVVSGNMNNRSSIMRGFSRITKCILHEIGHYATHDDLMKQYTMEEIKESYRENRRANRGNYGYVKIPCERMATDWAIHWLEDAEHRKIAKKFEKKFWACFAAE